MGRSEIRYFGSFPRYLEWALLRFFSNNIISELGDLSKKDLHPKPVTDEEKKEEQDAMDQLNIQIHKIFLKNVDGSYEESDQSELIEDGVDDSVEITNTRRVFAKQIHIWISAFHEIKPQVLKKTREVKIRHIA